MEHILQFKMSDAVMIAFTRRLSQRLIGKRVAYRETSGTTPFPECGRSSGEQPLRTVTAVVIISVISSERNCAVVS